MNVVAAQNLGECWLKCVAQVLEQGELHYDEDVAIREILGLSVEIACPSSKDDFISRTGDQKVIKKMLKKFSKGVVMEDRPFTYGQLIYDMNGIDQFEWIIRRIRKKPETKSATISLISPGLEALNLPCLIALDAKIRKGALHLQFFFRSQNIFGRQYANLLALAALHERLSLQSGYSIGSMKGYIASAHIYDFDLVYARELIRTKKIQITDYYYTKGPASVRS
ncbi:MAG: thymidylate synthase [Candidatus Thiodiazotropha sp.]